MSYLTPSGMGMATTKRRIRFRIESEFPTFDAVISVLQGTQEAMFAIGRYLEGTPLYGRLHSKVKIPCSLVLTKISMNSPIEAEASVADMTDQLLFAEEGKMEVLSDLGGQCVDIFMGAVDAVYSGPSEGQKKLKRIVKDPKHRLDIVRRVVRMIPDDMPLEIGTRERLYRFVPETKQAAIDLAGRIEKEVVPSKGIKTIIGPVIEARIIDNRYFKIGHNQCSFREEDVTFIEDLLGKVVSLSGKAVDVGGKTQFTEISDLKQIENWEFKAIESGTRRIALSTPLLVTVGFHEDLVWISDTAGLDISGAGETWKEALEDFNEQFMVALVGYASQPDQRLTRDAIELKMRLRDLVPTWKEALSDVDRH